MKRVARCERSFHLYCELSPAKLNLLPMASFREFQQIDVRVGMVADVRPFCQGQHSTHILSVDLGRELGVKKSLARLAPNYEGAELVGRQVLCVVNLPPRQIGSHMSEVLVLGVPDQRDNVILVRPDRDVPLGSRLY